MPETEEATLLPQEMPHWAARGATYTILALALAAGVACVVVRVPEIVRCAFVLVPQGGADPVQSPWAGEVESVSAVEGQPVRAGQELFTLRSSEVRAWRAELASIEEDLARLAHRAGVLPAERKAEEAADQADEARALSRERHLTAELAQLQRARETAAGAHQAALKTQAAQVAALDKKLANRKTYHAQVEAYVQASEKLAADRVLSASELMTRRLQAADAALAVTNAEQDLALAKLKADSMEIDRKKEVGQEEVADQKAKGELAGARASLDKLRQEAKARSLARDNRRRDLAADVEKASLQAAERKSRLADTVGDRFRVRAPFTGTVLTVSRKNAGDVVGRGTELAQIARSDSPIVAELAVPEEGMARLRAGQPVKLLFEAYPYQRYGPRAGTVSLVLPSVVRGAQGTGGGFVARATLESLTVQVAGDSRPLRVGMKGEARVLVGRRPLLEYVFEPLRRLKENLSDVRVGGRD